MRSAAGSWQYVFPPVTAPPIRRRCDTTPSSRDSVPQRAIREAAHPRASPSAVSCTRWRHHCDASPRSGYDIRTCRICSGIGRSTTIVYTTCSTRVARGKSPLDRLEQPIAAYRRAARRRRAQCSPVWSILGSSVMLPEDFHPVLQRWWERAPEPGSGRILPAHGGAARGLALDPLRAHTLIAAPPARGNLAAFLTSIASCCRASRPGELAGECDHISSAAQGALRRYPQEPRRAAARDAAHRRGDGSRPLYHRLREERGHASRRARRHAALTAAHPGDDARVAVSAPDGRALAPDAEDGARGHRREIHAVLESRRGATSRSRWSASTCVRAAPAARGLSATQKPIEDVAQFLVGSGSRTAPSLTLP